LATILFFAVFVICQSSFCERTRVSFWHLARFEEQRTFELRAFPDGVAVFDPIKPPEKGRLPAIVKLTASSRGDRSGFSRARLTIAVSILSGSLFQIRRGLGLPSSRASIPPSWYRLYQS
jgi:hypothetical protein